MVQKQTSIKNPTGLHARPASQLAQLCKKFPEEIALISSTHQVNPKNIMSILSSGMKQGTAITVQVEGANEQAVCDEIVSFIENLSE